jgi:hypothetical protein
MTGLGPFEAPPQGKWGRGVLAGKQGRETEAGAWGGLEASEGLSSTPGVLSHALGQKGSPNFLRGYRFQNDLIP